MTDKGYRIYTVKTGSISPAEYCRSYALMSFSRQEKCRRYVREEDRRLCIAASFLVRRQLSEITGIKEEELSFYYNGYGKPFCKNREIPFSLSHSADRAVCVIGKRNSIGIDIEKIRPVKAGILKLFCSGKDMEYIENNTEGLIKDPETLSRIFRVWTFKEAYFKCKGTGIDDSVREVSYNESNCFSEEKDGFVITVYEQ